MEPREKSCTRTADVECQSGQGAGAREGTPQLSHAHYRRRIVVATRTLRRGSFEILFTFEHVLYVLHVNIDTRL